MTEQDYLTDGRAKAAELRREAADDDRAAEEAAERNPSFSEYLSRRAEWRRRLANDADGGYGQ